jgi:GDP-4-dehydro-6-deoxy-D-mannose reductase
VGGFAGTHLARHLAEQGDAVLGVERTPREGPVSVLAWDVAADPPPPVVEEIRRFAPDVVYHLAAVSLPDQCSRDPALAWSVNRDGTRRVADLCEALATKPRLVFISSSHVYGAPSGDEVSLSEEAPLSPRGIYGQTKAAAEEVVRTAAGRGLDVVIVRAFNHTGPGQLPPLVVPEWIEKYRQHGPELIEVRTLDAWFDLSDVRDVVRAYRLLAQSGRAGETVNVGSGTAVRTGDMLRLIQDRLDPGRSRRVVETYPGLRRDGVACVDRLRERTGWQPMIPLRQSIDDAILAISSPPSP